MTVADRIIKRRKELDITQDELAKMLGLSGRSSISKIEDSGNAITLKNIRRIAQALRCTEYYLMGYEDDKSDEKASDRLSAEKNEIFSYIERFDEKQIKLLKSYVELLSKGD